MPLTTGWASGLGIACAARVEKELVATTNRTRINDVGEIAAGVVVLDVKVELGCGPLALIDGEVVQVVAAASAVCDLVE